MKEIDKFVDSMCKNMNDISKETLDIKDDIKLHLLETVDELKRCGKSEAESIQIALDRFGKIDEIEAFLPNFPIKTNKKLKFITNVSIISLCALLLFLLINAFLGNIDQINGGTAIIIIPIYLIIRCGTLKNNIKLDQTLDVKKEFINFSFVLYFSFFIAKEVFPIYALPDFKSKFHFNMYFIPLTTVLERINHSGIPINIIVFSLLKTFAIYLPIGFLYPNISKKSINLKNSLKLGLAVYLLVIFINVILCVLGLSVRRTLVISIDYLIISLLGTLAGYTLYKLFRNIYKF